MRVIIAGSRTATPDEVQAAIRRCPWINFVTCVVSGTARGADAEGEAWARSVGLRIDAMPADWRKHGKAAGPIRNREMAQRADGLIAVWDGKSPGTKNMIDEARKEGLRVFVFIPPTGNVELWEADGRRLDRWDDLEERAAIMALNGKTRWAAEQAAARLLDDGQS